MELRARNKSVPSFPRIKLMQPSQKKSAKEYSKEYRERIKQNKDLHRVSKDHEKLRIQEYRFRQSEESMIRCRELQ